MILGFAFSSGVFLDRVFLTFVGVLNSNSGPRIVALELLTVSALSLIVVGIGLVVVWRHKSWFTGIAYWKRAAWYLVALFIPMVMTVVQFYLIMFYALGGS